MIVVVVIVVFFFVLVVVFIIVIVFVVFVVVDVAAHERMRSTFRTWEEPSPSERTANTKAVLVVVVVVGGIACRRRRCRLLGRRWISPALESRHSGTNPK